MTSEERKRPGSMSDDDWNAEFEFYFVEGLQKPGDLAARLTKHKDQPVAPGRTLAPGTVSEAKDLRRGAVLTPVVRHHIQVLRMVLEIGPHQYSPKLHGETLRSGIGYKMVDAISRLLPRWARDNGQYRQLITQAGATEAFWAAVATLPPPTGSATAVAAEVAAKLEQLHERPGLVIDDQVSLYRLVAALIRRPQQVPANRALSIASLHGHIGRRTTAEAEPGSELALALADFSAALAERISSVDEPWAVRQVVNVVSLDRFNQVSKRQLAQGGVSNQIRAVVEPGALPVPSPLVIANTYASIGLDDTRLFHAGAALFEYGSDAVKWMLEYFDMVWAAAPYELRDRVGNNDSEIEQLRTDLAAGSTRRARLRPS